MFKRVAELKKVLELCDIARSQEMNSVPIDSKMVEYPICTENSILAPIRIDGGFEGRFDDVFVVNVSDPISTSLASFLEIPEFVSIKDQIEEFLCIPKQNSSFLLPIRIEIIVGRVYFLDHFEWDLNNLSNDIETFADVICNENKLDKEFSVAISHQIREQCFIAQKYFFEAGEFPVYNDKIGFSLKKILSKKEKKKNFRGWEREERLNRRNNRNSDSIPYRPRTIY